MKPKALLNSGCRVKFRKDKDNDHYHVYLEKYGDLRDIFIDLNGYMILRDYDDDLKFIKSNPGFSVYNEREWDIIEIVEAAPGGLGFCTGKTRNDTVIWKEETILDRNRKFVGALQRYVDKHPDEEIEAILAKFNVV